MKYFFLGWFVGLASAQIVFGLMRLCFRTIHQWNIKRKQERYECGQRHKGLAIRKTR